MSNLRRLSIAAIVGLAITAAFYRILGYGWGDTSEKGSVSESGRIYYACLIGITAFGFLWQQTRPDK